MKGVVSLDFFLQIRMKSGRKKMELAGITAQQVTELFLLILAGYVGAKTGVIKQEGKKHFSDLLLYLVAPAMVFSSYLTEIDERLLKNLGNAFLWGAILLFTGIVLSLLAFSRVHTPEAPIMRFACMFSNSGYMGFPLIQALFGSEGLLYASGYVTIFNILVWTVGYGMLSRKICFKEMIRSIISTPVIWAIVAGMAVFLLQIPVPEIIRQPLDYIGGMNTPLAMLITGMMIAGCDLKRMVRRAELPFIIAVRMFFIPGFCFLLFFLLKIHGTVANIVLLLEACPSAAVTSVFAVQMGFDEELAAGAVVFTTFLSILMLPIWAYLLTAMF